jgi:hypothetical protein
MLLRVHNVVTQDRAGSGGREWETGGAGGEQVQYSGVRMDYGCGSGVDAVWGANRASASALVDCGLRIVGCGPWGKCLYVCNERRQCWGARAS